MIKQYFIQAIGQLKQHPLISSINIMGTSLAIFLIMLVVMINNIGILSFSPESNRDRFLHGSFISIGNKNWGDDSESSSNGALSLKSINEIYKSLKTPEFVTAYTVYPSTVVASIPGQNLVNLEMRETDAEYFKVFDYTFLEGKPYNKEDVDSHIPLAVLSESTARSIFGTSKGVVGKYMLINYSSCKVIGVVKNVSILAEKGFSEIWVPLGTISPAATYHDNSGIMGAFSATILAKDRDDFDDIRKEYNKRLDEYNKSLEPTGFHIIPRNRPYDQESENQVIGANLEPDVNKARKIEIIIYVILLLVPAINLASMTQSRLRQRMIEVGVRRAFGSTRMQLLNQIIIENLIITLIAGVIGLILSLIFANTMASEFLQVKWNPSLTETQINFSMLFQPKIFIYAIFFCFVLNILSCGIPAWRASRSNIVNSLGGKIM